MPVPLSLISTLNSVKKGAEIIVDSFEVWPNGTDSLPDGWAKNPDSPGSVSNGEFSRSTSNVSDQTYSMRVNFSGQGVTVRKAFDLTDIGAVTVDVNSYNHAGYGDLFLKVPYDGVRTTMSSVGTFAVSTHDYTGNTYVNFEAVAIGGAIDAYVDNLRLIPESLILRDSFENWPNGTSSPPEGWTLNAGLVSQNTNSVSEGSFSLELLASATMNEIQKDFDLTDYDTLVIDCLSLTDSNNQFDIIVNGNSTTFTGTGTKSLDISGYIGINTVKIYQYKSLANPEGVFDNLMLIP
jgi:hypothetical protein